MEPEDECEPRLKPAPDDIPKVHSVCNHNRPHTRFLCYVYLIFIYFLNIFTK